MAKATINLNEAVARFKEVGVSIAATTIANNLETGAFQFGVCTRREGSHKRWVKIYRNDFEKYLKEHGLTS